MKRIALPVLTLACGALASPATASSSDYLQLNTTSPSLEIAFKGATDPADRHVPLTFSASRRTAFSREAPLKLPCDVEKIYGNMIIHNVSGSPVYPEMQAELFVDGIESQAIPNYYGFATSKGVLPLQLAGSTISPGYIIVDPNFVNYTPASLPADRPIKLILRPRAYSNNVFDHAIGGYTQADLLPEIVWNNVKSIWIMRSCS